METGITWLTSVRSTVVEIRRSWDTNFEALEEFISSNQFFSSNSKLATPNRFSPQHNLLIFSFRVLNLLLYIRVTKFTSRVKATSDNKLKDASIICTVLKA